MATDDIHTSADPAYARDTVLGLFASAGCEVRPTSDFAATIERGSPAMTFLFGALAGKSRQHLKYDVSVFTAPQGGSVVRISSATSGVMAGAVGMARARKAYGVWRDQVVAALPH